ncbi:MAG TPA: zf-HC2 domain-containing protein [Spirochaetia bacterium]|nr:zf-HC2 domain-containing protein [Spirochaetia bacterium]
MSFSCLFVRHYLDRFADGELSIAKASRVQAHLSTCSRCAAELEAVRDIGKALRGAEPPAVDEAGWERIWRGVAAGASNPERHVIAFDNGKERHRRSVRPRYVLAAGIAAAALAAVVTLQWFESNGQAAQPSTATYINYHESALSDHVLLENHFYSAQTVAVSYVGR